MFRFRRLGLALACLSALAACATKQPFADDAAIAAVSYRDAPYTAITLYTMVNNRTGGGAHTSLLIGASERVIFDPAGTFQADPDAVSHAHPLGVQRAALEAFLQEQETSMKVT